MQLELVSVYVSHEETRTGGQAVSLATVCRIRGGEGVGHDVYRRLWPRGVLGTVPQRHCQSMVDKREAIHTVGAGPDFTGCGDKE